jgi:nucleotide-binding universal stress UspA family protein
VSIHLDASQQHDDATQRPTPRSIVVGVDDRGRSVSAVVWAVEEAEHTRTSLILLSAGGESTQDPGGDHDVSALARRLTLGDVETRRVEGDAVDALVSAAGEADLLVVGCRSMGPAQRMVVGSTSRAAACWSPVPVVIVPEAWMQPSMATAPLVAAVRPVQPGEPLDDEPDREVLDFAFARAALLKVPLVVVSAWDLSGIDAWSPADVDHLHEEWQASLERRLAPWRDSHPHVELVVRCVAEEAHRAVVEASLVSQMVVIGRHHSAALCGSLGRTPRAVLHHASRPVAVVPTGTREELVRDLAIQRAQMDRPWAPTF